MIFVQSFHLISIYPAILIDWFVAVCSCSIVVVVVAVFASVTTVTCSEYRAGLLPFPLGAFCSWHARA